MLKGKLATGLFKSYRRLRQKPYWVGHFWARGYFVNTVGLDEELIRRYVKYREEQEKKRERERRDYDLVFIERLWRSAGYEDIYLKSYADGRALQAGLAAYFRFYNEERIHQALGYLCPAKIHYGLD